MALGYRSKGHDDPGMSTTTREVGDGGSTHGEFSDALELESEGHEPLSDGHELISQNDAVAAANLPWWAKAIVRLQALWEGFKNDYVYSPDGSVRLLHYMKTSEFKAIFKSVLAYMLSVSVFFFPSLFELVKPLYLHIIQLPVIVLLNDPSRSIGAMLESSIYYFISVLLTGLISYLVVPRLLHSTFLMLTYFFVAIFVIHLLKASYPKQLTSTMNAITLIVISSVLNSYRDFSNDHYSNQRITSQVEVGGVQDIQATRLTVVGVSHLRSDQLAREHPGVSSLGE